jgi:hypothetical protein
MVVSHHELACWYRRAVRIDAWVSAAVLWCSVHRHDQGAHCCPGLSSCAVVWCCLATSGVVHIPGLCASQPKSQQLCRGVVLSRHERVVHIPGLCVSQPGSQQLCCCVVLSCTSGVGCVAAQVSAAMMLCGVVLHERGCASLARSQQLFCCLVLSCTAVVVCFVAQVPAAVLVLGVAVALSSVVRVTAQVISAPTVL